LSPASDAPRNRHLAAQPESRDRHEDVTVSGRAPDYLFGQSAGEAERLRLQARMFAPYTARFLEDTGVSPGMKVLDVGTGAGDVALLAAGLAGREGTVVGIDFNAELIQTARARAAAAGMENVSFVVGDAASAGLDRDFDAVVGRCVLFFAGEPAALVRRLTGYVRDGGIVAFQEPANATLAPMSLPHSRCWNGCGRGSLRPTAARIWTCIWACGCAAYSPGPGSRRRRCTWTPPPAAARTGRGMSTWRG
jgi:2-polyprenyl-3-methyl-5-hydroxy-6-metoxy-1,4-benzoquinol methylase